LRGILHGAVYNGAILYISKDNGIGFNQTQVEDLFKNKNESIGYLMRVQLE
jgi:hypothetical protein